MGWLEWRERLRTQGGTASVLTVRLVLGSCEDYCCPPAFSGARARLTEDLPTRSVEAIVSRLLPCSRIVRASSVRSGVMTVGRPPCRPWRRAASRPAWVRSTIMRRSIWARAEVVDGVDDVADGSSEAIKFPDDKDITVVIA